MEDQVQVQAEVDWQQEEEGEGQEEEEEDGMLPTQTQGEGQEEEEEASSPTTDMPFETEVTVHQPDEVRGAKFTFVACSLTPHFSGFRFLSCFPAKQIICWLV